QAAGHALTDVGAALDLGKQQPDRTGPVAPRYVGTERRSEVEGQPFARCREAVVHARRLPRAAAGPKSERGRGGRGHSRWKESSSKDGLPEKDRHRSCAPDVSVRVQVRGAYMLAPPVATTSQV